MKRKKANPNECFQCGKPVGADQPGSSRWDFSDVVYCDRACWDARREEGERTRLWMTAVHEAGHCLGARLGNRRITKATIEPSKKFDGCVHSEHDISKPVFSTYVIEEWLLGHAAEVEFGFTGGIGHDWDYDHVVEMLKAPIKSAKSKAWSERTGIWGKVGKHKHAPYSTWDINPRWGYGTDGKTVNYVKDWRKSVRVTKPEWKPEFDKYVRKARRLAKKYRAWIECVANLLLEKRTLSDKNIPRL
ncbi:MAG TPA: hypothetical protein VGR71_10470 [Nitrospira sp.]|nr:hypothetical protein [Nitrospira sp.]